MSIHPTAVIDESAQVDPSNQIGPHVVIERDTVIGPNNRLMAGSFVGMGTRIGSDNVLHPHSVVGHDPQDFGYSGNHDQEPSYTQVGNGNVFREGVTIHRGTKPGTTTEIGNGCMFMANSHVAHNGNIGNRVILANGALLGGYVTVEDHVFISANNLVHQFCRVGRNAMMGGHSGINQDAPPFLLTRGVPGRVYSLNAVGLRRAGFSSETRQALKTAAQAIFHDGRLPQEVAPEFADHEVPEVAYLARFILESKRGVCQSGNRRE